METIRGRKSLELDFNELKSRLAGYDKVMFDLGTGDGRYVHTLAHHHPNYFVIGVDTCRENLREHSQAKLQNMLFLIAKAQDLPSELNGMISQITINFPWGSLLESLLSGDLKLMHGLEAVSRPTTPIHLHLNSGAMAEVGWTLPQGVEKICHNLLERGWQIESYSPMDRNALRAFPTTWSKRLAFGRDPRAVALQGYIARG